TRVGTFSGRSVRSYPISYAGAAGGGASHWFPVSCSRSATGIPPRVVLRPPRSSAFLTVGLPDHQHGLDRDGGCHVPHAAATPGVGCPLHPVCGGGLRR